jgi:lipopolysaccharide export system protein LptA
MKNLICLSLLLTGFGTSLQAFAEAADRDKPIELEADTVIVNDAKQTSTYTGTVVLTQGTLVIRADKLVVREDKEGFQHSTSTGNPTTFKQKREGKNEYMEGSAQRIEYDGRMDKVQLYTKAWVKRGEDIVHGEYISYDANAEYAEVIGGTKSESNPGSGRVKAIIQPKNKPAAAPATKPGLQQTPDQNPSGQQPESSAPSSTAPVSAAPSVTKNLRFSNRLETSENLEQNQSNK